MLVAGPALLLAASSKAPLISASSPQSHESAEFVTLIYNLPFTPIVVILIN